MDIAKALGEMFRDELQARMAPLQAAVRRMDEGLAALEMLRSATYRLAPLTSRLGSMAGVRTPSVIPEPASTRGAGRGRRKAAVAAPGRAPAAKKAPVVAAAPVKRARADEGARSCAIIGCKRPSRSKGYCSAHYQKLRLLMRTNRRPAEWVDDASPQSVREVALPRGRAASKALKEGAPIEPPKPAAPPKPKAWVRKKGNKSGLVSLH
ncbi:vegetative protein [Pyxidicoccus fallax]|uniref:Vegetative protein n=1 Tax=Pyxidicoccus fallax TaxID=394095 RepID=A0A848LRU0_9BACT|nr:vegetative protein [Pyxidicoccus fallax]NMO20476.1 vegetative protein [Pyxidicoccus fallax]NPC81363.1 vegetative protein [Pyxidicoccus fallax]